MLALACLGCANRDRLVVYADPWLLEYAEERVAGFRTGHPGTDVDLKVISSEVIAQHLHYGQPVDVVLCVGPQWLQGKQAWAGEERLLAGTRMVEVGPSDANAARKQDALGGSGCLAIEASGRPLRRLSEQWLGSLPAGEGCTLIANFQRQMQDYMLRGWVSRGLVPEHFARRHATNLVRHREGPWVSGFFAGILVADAPHPELARAFFEDLGSEKSREALGRLGFVP